MLGHPDRDRRQLRNLVPPRLSSVNTLELLEGARAGLAPLGPMLDDLINLFGRKQTPVLALVPLPASQATPRSESGSQ